MSVLTPNMNLIEPTIGLDSGLVWEQSINGNSSTIDQHNHTPGFGIQIPPAGLNINSDLSFSNNSAVNLKSTVFSAQSSFATLLSLYVIGNDLYYNDGASNVVRMTSGGTVNATSSGIVSGSATASFSAGVLVVNAAANTPANIQGASILLGNNVANSKFLTLAPPAAMASNFSLTLPNIPGAQSFVTIDASGNFGTPIAYSQGITASNIAANTITASQIANATITTSQISASAGITGSQIANATITGGGGGNLASNTVSYANMSASNIVATAITNGTYGNGNSLLSGISFTGNGHPLMLSVSSTSVSGGLVGSGAFQLRISRTSPLSTNYAFINFPESSAGSGFALLTASTANTTTYAVTLVSSANVVITDTTFTMTELR